MYNFFILTDYSLLKYKWLKCQLVVKKSNSVKCVKCLIIPSSVLGWLKVSYSSSVCGSLAFYSRGRHCKKLSCQDLWNDRSSFLFLLTESQETSTQLIKPKLPTELKCVFLQTTETRMSKITNEPYLLMAIHKYEWVLSFIILTLSSCP